MNSHNKIANLHKVDIFKLDDMDKYVQYLLKPIGDTIQNFIKKNLTPKDMILQKEKLVKHPEIMNLKLVEIFYDLYKTSNNSLLKLPTFHTDHINTIIDYYIKKVIINKEAFFLINLSDIERKYNHWKLLFPKIMPYFAIKSNPDKRIITLLNSLGCNFDCASMEEIKIAIHLGVKPSQIIYANPVKSIEYLLYAREYNIELMTFDSIEELHKIKKYYPNAKIILRIKTNDTHASSKLSFKFGMEKHEFEIAINLCIELQLSLVGVSFHVGSNTTDVNGFITALEDCRHVFDMADHKGIKLNILDIGGGFTFETANEYHNFINNKIDTLFLKTNKYRDIQVISEPGRYFVETSHTLILNIIGKKSSSESDKEIVKYYLNDGIYGSMNNIIRDYAKISIYPINNQKNDFFPSIFFGPTCDSYDTIANNILFPISEINDWVYVKNMGAYTRAGACEFNGFPQSICYYYYDNIN
jgi:ornithine decarboxylase